MPRPHLGERLVGLALALLLASCTSPAERRAMTLERADEQLARGDHAAAVATLQSFLDYDPRDVVVTVRLAALDLETDHAYQALRRLESLPSGGVRGDEYFEVLTRALVGAGRLERALPMLLARADSPDGVDPKLVDVLVWRSVEEPALSLPGLPTPWRARRVEGLIQAGKLPEALEQWRRLDADTDSGTNTDTSKLLELWIQTGLARDALTLLSDTEEVHTGHGTPWKLLARHRLLLARGEEGEAAEIERQFLGRFPGHPRRYDMLLSVARRENRSGRPEEALLRADQATALRPSEVAPLLEKALALRGLGRADEAESQLELVLALDPGHQAAKLLLQRGDDRRQEDKPGSRVERLELRLDTSGSG